MKLSPLSISGAWLVESPIHSDARGDFREWFKLSEISSVADMTFSVAQANYSQSKRGVVRGIHYSLAVPGQAKWITCLSGRIKDVVVDIRPNSPTYGKFVTVDLFGDSGKSVLISAGLGHGFSSLKEGSSVAYLVSSPFSPLNEFEVNPLDAELGIDWGLPIGELLFSAKDQSAPTLKQRELEGKLPQ